MTQVMAPESAVTDRATNRFYCPVFGVKPIGYDAARGAEKAELDRERIRLWYVAATRARELLVIPRLDVAATKSAWIALLDLSLAELSALDLAHLSPRVSTADIAPANGQTREIFAQEAADIAGRHRQLVWLAPSRDESATGPVVHAETPSISISAADDEPVEKSASMSVQGGRERGLIMHKLLEEVLMGETKDETPALIERAGLLIRALGRPAVNDPAQGLSPVEIAGCITRTLGLPEIVSLRPTLAPEFPVYVSTMVEELEQATAGVADAISFAADGTPQVVVDWKSDVDPASETIEHYRKQVRSYLETTGTERGLIVLVTSGVVVPVSPPADLQLVAR
jgi:exodeoxyribonuclease-5